MYPYEYETRKHVYGKTDRWPGERLFVQHLNALHASRPNLKMLLMGTSGVHGEYFPLFQTMVEFTLPNEDAIDVCRHALKTSDELIRRRIDSLWEWESAWFDRLDIVFFVNWHDFAYFMKNKEIFLSKDHARFALDFGVDVSNMRYEHYKILRNGSVEVFDVDKITPREKEVLAHLDEIEISREFRPARY